MLGYLCSGFFYHKRTQRAQRKNFLGGGLGDGKGCVWKSFWRTTVRGIGYEY